MPQQNVLSFRTVWCALVAALAVAWFVVPATAAMPLVPGQYPTILAAISATAIGDVESAAMDRLQTAFPGVQSYHEGAQLTRLYGRPFGSGETPVLSAARFLAANANVFGAEPGDLLPATRIQEHGNTLPLMFEPETDSYRFTLLNYSQYRDGLPVFRSDVRLLVRNEPGYPLVWAGSSLKRLGDFHPNAALVSAVDPTAVAPGMTSFTAMEPVIWAGIDDQEVAPVQAVAFEADNYGSGQNPQKWLYVVDASSGAVLYREDRIISTDVTGSVHGMATTLPKSAECNPEVDTPMAYAKAAIGTTTAYADANGDYTIPNSGTTPVTVTSYMSGQYFNVVEKSTTPLETMTLPNVTPPGPANFLHNSANTSEAVRAQVNAYVQANKVRDWVLVQNPSYPTIAAQTGFTLNVNYGYTCNAYYDGSSLNFYLAGGGCANTAYSNVVHHEYGHHIVACGGSGQNEYGEGMSDCVAVCIADDPIIGYGFEGDCSIGIRDANNTMQYPCSGEIHYCGQLISGCIWSTRNELQSTHPSDYLSILSRLLVNSVPMHTGSAITPQITIDFLTLDDDDGNPNNGTPHRNEICAGFGAHNMGCPLLPHGLGISPTAGFTSWGLVGGPFTPACQTYTLTNAGGAALDWTAGATVGWLEVTPAGGTLAPGGTATMEACINANANSLPAGTYTDTVTFTDVTSGAVQTRPARLQVGETASLPFVEDFEGGPVLLPCWTITGTNSYRSQVTSANGPHAGTGHLTMDSSVDLTYSRNELTLTVDLANREHVVLTFWARSFGDDPHGPPPSPFIGGADFDGVAISADGTTWYEVQGLRTLSATYSQLTVDLDAAAALHGLTYNSQFRIRFNQYDNYTIPTDGIGIDDIHVTGEIIDDLAVAPATAFKSFGEVGGPFTPACQTYTLTNAGGAALDWTAGATVGWLEVTPAGGTLAPGGTATVDVCLNANANSLPVGSYSDTVTFTNVASGVVQARNAHLLVGGTASLPFAEHFEDGPALLPYWAITGTNSYRSQVTSANGPHAGTGHLTMDSSVDLTYSRNELTLTIDLANREDVVLSFWACSFGDDPHGPPPSPFIGGADFDGVAISADGTTWYEVQGLRTLSATYSQLTVDLDAAAAQHSLTYNSHFKIRFNQYDNYTIPTDGIGIDDIVITGNVIDDLAVTPATLFESVGEVGGPFTPACQTYTLTNAGSAALDWTAGATVAWLDVAPAAGALAPGGTATVEVCINANANSLPAGTYPTAATFTNLASGVAQTRGARLEVNEPCLAPPAATDPNPADGAAAVPITADLSWTGNPGYDGFVDCFLFGGTGETWTGAPRLRANVITVSSAQELSEIRMQLSFTGPTNLYYYVFEATSSAGPYTPAFEKVVATTGTGLAFYSSGPMSAPLQPGRYYAVGAAWASPSISYYRNLSSFPVNWALGTIVGYLSSDTAPPYTGATGSLYTIGIYSMELCFGSGGDCPESFDVYFGTVTPPAALLCTNLSGTLCDPGVLAYNTTYYWQVVAKTPAGSTPGPVWSFATETCAAPPAAADPDPADQATDVSVTADLAWDGGRQGDPGQPDLTCPKTYDVYFGLDNPPATLLCSNLSGTTCAPGLLAFTTTYYWQVVAKTPGGSTPGPVWSFTTGSCDPPPAATGPDPADGATGVSVGADLSWAPTLRTGSTCEPDDYPDGQNISQACAGVTLSAQGSGSVYALVSTPASTGTSVFGASSTVAYWCSSPVFRADFTDAVGEVSLDFVGDDSSDRGFLEAHNAAGALLVRLETGVLGTGQVETLTITRPAGDIAYLLAAGVGSDCLKLDHLVHTGGNLCETTFDVYFGTDTPPTTLLCSDLSGTTCDPGVLAYNTTYYWQVVAKTPGGSTPGPVWSFATEGCDPPPAAANPGPADGATGVPPYEDLTWTAGPDFGGFVDCFSFGGTNESFTGSPRLRSDVITVSSAQVLSEIRMPLSFTGTTNLYYYVFEATSSTGPYTPVFEKIAASTGTGAPVLYSSGPINVSLQTGRYYGVGAAWASPAITYYRVLSPFPTSWPLGTTVGVLTTDTSPPYSGTTGSLATTCMYAIDMCFGGGDSCPESFDVYFGTDNPPAALLCSDLSGTTCDPGVLTYHTTYYWQVVAKTAGGSTPGPVWSFTTASCDAPPAATAPIPANGAVDAAIDTNLSWSDDAPVVPPTVEILAFIGHSDNSATGEYQHTLSAIAQYVTDFHVTTTITEVPATLAGELAGKDVFLVPEQETWTQPAMAAWGDNIAAVLQSFAAAGGVVIAADDGDNGNSASFINHTGLMSLGAATTPAFSVQPCTVVEPSHPLMANVPLAFNAENGNTTFPGTTNGVVLATRNSTGQPIVLARELSAGGVVLMGWDYYAYNSDMARVIANAVQWRGGGAGCPRTYDVYFGTDSPPAPLLCSDLSGTVCDPGPLDYYTTYYWQVVAKTAGAQTPGPIWSFTTQLPGCGDLNGDGHVDGVDFAVFLAAYGRCTGDAQYNAAADMNGDGCVTLVDYQRWLQCYRDYHGDPLAPPPAPSDLGDVNGDGLIDGLDIQPFVNVVLDPGAATMRERLVTDFNADGRSDAADIGLFVARLVRQ